MSYIIINEAMKALRERETENFTIGSRADLYKYAWDAGRAAGIKDAQPKWISVEERLPEEKMAVLVYGQRRVFNGKKIETFPMEHVAFLDEGWFTWDSEDVIDVTHWMSLPSTEGIE